MGTEINIQDSPEKRSSNHTDTNRSVISSKRSVILSLIAFIILCLLFGAIIYQRYTNLKQNKNEEALTVANNARVRLQESLAFSLSATKTLSFFIQNDGSVKNFDSIASLILNTTKDIDALQLVPDGVIRYTYPLKGNEQAIGYDILKDPARNKEAFKAIEKKEIFFAGPFELKQGGMGVVGRLPIFRNNKFWGFSAVVIKMPTLLRAARIDSSGKTGYYFQLSKINPESKKEEFFIPHQYEFSDSHSVSVNVPNGEWKLSVIPVKELNGFVDILLLSILGLSFSILGGSFVYSILQRPKQLNDLVNERTLQLKEKELKYRSLIEQASDGIIITDLEGNIQEVNQSIAKMGGYNIEEMPGKHVREFIPKEDIDANPFRFHELLKGGSLLHERRFLKSDGTFVDVEVNSKLTNLNTLIGFVRDISGRKLAEEAIKISEEKYRTLVDQASDGIFIADKSGRFLIVNPSGYAMSQYSEEELKNLSIYDLVLPEDIKTDPFHFSEMMNNKVARSERRMKKKDGTLLDVEVTAKFISGDRFLAFVRDITERKKNEDILRYQARLLDAVSDAITSLDMNRRIVSWNHACEELYGFTTAEVMGKRIPELVEFEFSSMTTEEVFKQVYKEGHWKGEFNFILPKTNARKYLLSSISLLKNKEGDVIGFILASGDITDLKKTEEEINKSNERFELIAQATNEAVWDHDFIKDETWGNKKLYSLYGFEPGKEKVNFKMFLDRIHPDERDAIETRLKIALERSTISLSEEFRFKTANGEYRNFYDRAYIKYEADGKPLRILGAMQDITDREIIKQQILREKELSDSIINSLPGIFYLYNKEGKFLRWNKNFEAVTGYTGDEIRQMHPLDFFDKDDHALLTAKIANVFITGEDYVEAHFLLKNKQKIPYYFTGQAIVYEDETCLMGVGLDFSEREKAKQAILESETKYRELIEQASDGIFISDRTGKYIDVNSSACRMLGYTKEELLNMSGAEILYHHKQVAGLPDRYDELKTGISSILETTLKRKDGSILTVESNSKMLPDGRFIGIVRDLTERKKADKALRESEERYRALVENAPEALVVMDVKKQVFVSVSESAEKLFKMSKEDLLKVGPVAVSPEYQPDGRLSSEVAMENIQKAIAGDKPVFEWTHRDKDGNLIPCEIWFVQLPSENEILIRGSIVNITERKKAAEKLSQSEQKYRLLFYNNPLPMWMATIPGLDIIDVNEAAIKQYGYTREEFLKLNTKNLRPAEDLDNFLKEVNKMVPGEINIRAWRHTKKDGTIIQVETYSHQIMYEGRMVWLGLSHDVTESYNAKELLQRSYEEIRQLASNLQSIREDERTNIAREIHDELGQQLTGLKMDMHWLTRKIKSSNEEVKKKMQASIELIDATIISVRKIATDLRPSILDDLGLFAALEWQSEVFEKRSGTKVDFINKAGEISVLPEVATALFRIFQELLTNIARYANASMVTAILHIDDNSLYFNITDNGIGFDINEINKKKTLGLLGIKERTLIMGGTYEIKSKPGEGTFVLISVPLYNTISNP